MPTTINCSMISRSQSRAAKFNYSTRTIKRILDREGWSYRFDQGSTIIIYFSKTFQDDAAAIAGRKSLDQAMIYGEYRLDSVTTI